MKDKTNNHDEGHEFNFFCDFPPFHVFCKNIPEIMPFFKKGSFWNHFGGKYRYSSNTPFTQINRDHEKYTIIMELPGISKDDITIEATSDELWFSAKSKEYNKTYRHHLYFKRSIRSNEMKAHLKNGILTITAPLEDKSPKTKIDVE